VGSFSTTLTFPNQLVWTNTAADATVNRTAGVTATWTGGAANSIVVISGSSSSATGGLTGNYTCTAAVSAGQFTVPAAVLLALPPGTGSMSVQNNANMQTFSASGIDAGFTFAGTAQTIDTKYN
jgi:hypothetical protein